MSDVLIVGDGPAGLSAALFLAKDEMSVKVFGQDQTLMHKAMVYNYLGIPEITGSEFQKVSRQQVEKFGAELLDGEVMEWKRERAVLRCTRTTAHVMRAPI